MTVPTSGGRVQECSSPSMKILSETAISQGLGGGEKRVPRVMFYPLFLKGGERALTYLARSGLHKFFLVSSQGKRKKGMPLLPQADRQETEGVETART